MVAQPFDGAHRMLEQITEGMTVYDNTSAKVGTVKQVYLGGEDLSEANVSGDSVLYDVPDSLRSRLAASGFVEIGTGFLAANRYATGEQVSGVDSDGVRLTVGKDDLVKK